MFACPLCVLDTSLARARNAVGHATRVTTRVQCTRVIKTLSAIIPARVSDLPQVRLIHPKLVIVGPDQGLVTGPTSTLVTYISRLAFSFLLNWPIS